MNVLVLGVIPSPLTAIVEKHGCNSIEFADPIDVRFLKDLLIDFAVSYRYRHIIREPEVEYLKNKIINLHISLLPWNRGADPNLWSFLKNTPKGVTIHYVDKGLDTGDIIAQKTASFDMRRDTLATTYHKLNEDILTLFDEQWPLIMKGKAERIKQPSGGSYHRIKDKLCFEHLLDSKGWNTRVADIIGKARNWRE